MKGFAKRTANIIPSASIAMAQRVGERDKRGGVIDPTWGQLDFDTPAHIKQAVYNAIASGGNGYQSFTGHEGRT